MREVLADGKKMNASFIDNGKMGKDKVNVSIYRAVRSYGLACFVGLD